MLLDKLLFTDGYNILLTVLIVLLLTAYNKYWQNDDFNQLFDGEDSPEGSLFRNKSKK